jgi:hypothetical protein
LAKVDTCSIFKALRKFRLTNPRSRSSRRAVFSSQVSDGLIEFALAERESELMIFTVLNLAISEFLSHRSGNLKPAGNLSACRARGATWYNLCPVIIDSRLGIHEWVEAQRLKLPDSRLAQTALHLFIINSLMSGTRSGHSEDFPSDTGIGPDCSKRFRRWFAINCGHLRPQWIGHYPVVGFIAQLPLQTPSGLQMRPGGPWKAGLTLLDYMRQLVGNQSPSLVRPRRKLTYTKNNVVTQCVRMSVHVLRRLPGGPAGMHPHSGKVVAEARLEEASF